MYPASYRCAVADEVGAKPDGGEALKAIAEAPSFVIVEVGQSCRSAKGEGTSVRRGYAFSLAARPSRSILTCSYRVGSLSRREKQPTAKPSRDHRHQWWRTCRSGGIRRALDAALASNKQPQRSSASCAANKTAAPVRLTASVDLAEVRESPQRPRSRQDVASDQS